METKILEAGNWNGDFVKCDCHKKDFFLPELEPEDECEISVSQIYGPGEWFWKSEIHEHQWKQYSECTICGAVSEEPTLRSKSGTIKVGQDFIDGLEDALKRMRDQDNYLKGGLRLLSVVPTM